jgi:hypothetical protein
MPRTRRSSPTPSIGNILRLLSPPPIAPTQPSFSHQQPSTPTSDTKISQPSNSHHSDQNADASAPQSNLSLAESLALLSTALSAFSTAPKSKSAARPQVPDVFDGACPAQLDTFIFQSSLYFAACSDDFPNDKSRVLFLLSYLSDTPLDWFQTELSHALSHGAAFPPWFTSLPNFLEELRRVFGPRNAVNDAITALESLECSGTQQALRYTLEFNSYARRTGWNDQALSHRFYKGLPDRLKDEVVRYGKPTGLADLQSLVAALDQRYWERISELACDEDSSSTHSRCDSASPTPSETTSAAPAHSRSYSASPTPSENIPVSPVHPRSGSASPALSDTPSDSSGSQDTHYSDAMEHPHSENEVPPNFWD